jgi:hypothetical protein
MCTCASIFTNWGTHGTRPVCDYAASGGHVDLLRWLHETGCPWGFTYRCRHVARDGIIDILLYLQQQSDGTYWNELLTDMLNKAGCNNQLEAAKWLRQQGAEWPDNADPLGQWGMPLAVDNWCGDTLAWARAEGCTNLS